MESLVAEASVLLADSLRPDKAPTTAATDGLAGLSANPLFPFVLLAVATKGENQGLKIAAAAYLKNLWRCNTEECVISPELHKDFRNQLAQALLQAERAVQKVLLVLFQVIVTNDFVKNNSWPELVPELRSVIQNSSLISENGHAKWTTINALTVLRALVKRFQYFLNPKVPREPVPAQLEIIADMILVPLQSTFSHFVDKVLSVQDRIQVELEEALLILCKCINFSVRSYMPSALGTVLPLFCNDFFRILDSSNLDAGFDGYYFRRRTMKRVLIISRSLVTRHRKHFDKLIPYITNCAFKIAKQSINLNNLDFLAERIISLAFDVISNVLETGPGWRYISPHFSSLLDSAIFPALVLNQKDASEWEEDAEEYMRKNLPSELGEVSGWAEDLFTARRSAINLLGVIAVSKAPHIISTSSKRKKNDKLKRKLQNSVGEMLVIPYLSKFPLPSDGTVKPSRIINEYYGVLMAYGGLQDFLRERQPEYTATLIQSRVLPIYSLPKCLPYLTATANWVVGSLASCLPLDISSDIYSSLMKALVMSDSGGINFYTVRASAAGAIADLLEVEYFPPDWLPLLQIIVETMSNEHENELSFLLELLSSVVEAAQAKIACLIPLIVSRVADAILKNLIPLSEPWPQVVVHGFTTLAAMARVWEDSTPEEVNQHQNAEWRSGSSVIASSLSSLLQKAWIIPVQSMEGKTSHLLPSSSCIDDSSSLLAIIMRFTTSMDEAKELKTMELLAIWAGLIADWQSWEENEDLSIFNCICEAIRLHKKCDLMNSFMKSAVLQKSCTSSTTSIIETIAAFVSKAIAKYPSASTRACSCAQMLLHVPMFSMEAEGIKKQMAISFTHAAHSRFREAHGKSVRLWKPPLLVVSSCFALYPENIKQELEKDADGGFTIWAHQLALMSSESFESPLQSDVEIKIAAMSLTKIVEQLVGVPANLNSSVLKDCFSSIINACILLKEVQAEDGDCGEDTKNADSDEDMDEEDEDDGDSDDDDGDGEREETEEEFLERYAKAAEDLENEMTEDDAEDCGEELGLASDELDGVDIAKAFISLVHRHHPVLVQSQLLQSSNIERMLDAFPEYASFFHSM